MTTTPIPLRVTGAARSLVTPFRLLLAAKTAVAAALAWYLAPLIPFAADEYSYYAPLGVVVSMYPTLADSARSSVQTLIGLAAGIGLGLAAVGLGTLGVPAVVALALVIAAGVLLGGLRVLGAGRDWIAMAALFVLLIGGTSSPDMFSFSYLVTMAFGVVVGIVVNVVIAPPVLLHRADRRLSALRDMLAARLDEMAVAVADGAVDENALDASMRRLATTLAEVDDEVTEAARSRRGNPRGWRQAPVQESNADRLRALERTTFFTRDLADVLARLPADDPALRGAARDRLIAAIRACRALVASEPRATEAAGLLAEAQHRVESYLDALDPTPRRVSGIAENATAGVCLRRLVDACRPLV